MQSQNIKISDMGTIAKYAVAAVVGIAIGALLAVLFMRDGEANSQVEVTTEIKYDTIPYYMPVPVDSYITHYECVKLPAVRDTLRDSLIYKDTLIYDSVNVIVPFTQKKYEDSTYVAYVSGFRPQLDSISIYRENNYKTITEKSGRWGIGITGGYGYGSKGFTSFVGVAVYYKLFEFKNRRGQKIKHENKR